MSELGEFLKRLRGQRSLREIEQLTGISHTYVSTIETGKDPRSGKVVKPSIETLRKLSNVYKYPLIELLIIGGYLHKKEIEEWKSHSSN